MPARGSVVAEGGCAHGETAVIPGLEQAAPVGGAVARDRRALDQQLAAAVDAAAQGAGEALVAAVVAHQAVGQRDGGAGRAADEQAAAEQGLVVLKGAAGDLGVAREDGERAARAAVGEVQEQAAVAYRQGAVAADAAAGRRAVALDQSLDKGHDPAEIGDGAAAPRGLVPEQRAGDDLHEPAAVLDRAPGALGPHRPVAAQGRLAQAELAAVEDGAPARRRPGHQGEVQQREACAGLDREQPVGLAAAEGRQAAAVDSDAAAGGNGQLAGPDRERRAAAVEREVVGAGEAGGEICSATRREDRAEGAGARGGGRRRQGGCEGEQQEREQRQATAHRNLISRRARGCPPRSVRYGSASA